MELAPDTPSACGGELHSKFTGGNDKAAREFSRYAVGAVVLKFLEQYIYKNPEKWYEWRNYPDVSISASPRSRVEIGKSPSLVKPAFGRIS